MRTNIVIDDELMSKAQQVSGIRYQVMPLKKTL